jgi:Leucine-rich repeat (LRR) protein
LKTIEPATFVTLPKLKMLTMFNNELTDFPSYCFHELPNLEELTLGQNKFESVPSCFKFMNDERAATASARSLRRLSLSDNKLKSLPKCAFASLTSLVFLGLRNCDIQTIEQGALDGGLVNLSGLNLESNAFASLDLSVFDTAELTNLLVIHLKSQSLKSVTTSSVTTPDTFLAKCSNQVVVILQKLETRSQLLDSLADKGKIVVIP